MKIRQIDIIIIIKIKEKLEDISQRWKGAEWEHDILEERQVVWGFKIPGMGNGMRCGWQMSYHEGYSDQNKECELHSESSGNPL